MHPANTGSQNSLHNLISLYCPRKRRNIRILNTIKILKILKIKSGRVDSPESVPIYLSYQISLSTIKSSLVAHIFFRPSTSPHVFKMPRRSGRFLIHQNKEQQKTSVLDRLSKLKRRYSKTAQKQILYF